MTETPETFEDEDRRLCPDETCIGLLGEDDRCKVCGRSADGAAGPAPYHEEEQEEEIRATGEPGGDDDDDRRLCPDGNCIGLLDDSGHCKVCGAAGS